jgi:hypothetical protein
LSRKAVKPRADNQESTVKVNMCEYSERQNSGQNAVLTMHSIMNDFITFQAFKKHFVF